MFIRVCFSSPPLPHRWPPRFPPADSAWLVATTQSLLTGLVNWRDNNPVAWNQSGAR